MALKVSAPDGVKVRRGQPPPPLLLPSAAGSSSPLLPGRPPQQQQHAACMMTPPLLLLRRAHTLPRLQVYQVGSGKAMPSWLSETKKRALRKDEEYR